MCARQLLTPVFVQWTNVVGAPRFYRGAPTKRLGFDQHALQFDILSYIILEETDSGRG